MKAEAKNHKYKIGQKVTVYRDPLTQARIEGSAYITERHCVPHYYSVNFVGKGNIVEKVSCFRFIY